VFFLYLVVDVTGAIVYGYLEQRLLNVPPIQLLVEDTESGRESRDLSVLCYCMKDLLW
jgi:hypothetical protein